MKIGTYEEVKDRMLEKSKLKTVEALASVIGTSPQSMSRMKKKGFIGAETVLKFAQKFDCSLDWLHTGEEPTLTVIKESLLEKVPAGISLQDFNIMLRLFGKNISEIKLEDLVKPRTDFAPEDTTKRDASFKAAEEKDKKKKEKKDKKTKKPKVVN